jgi:hypothetical protein
MKICPTNKDWVLLKKTMQYHGHSLTDRSDYLMI